MGVISPREQEVLDLLGEQLTHAEIADRLFLSVRTVESHAASLRRKLDLRDHRSLVRYAVAHRPLPGTPSQPLTDFLGRASELHALARLLASNRLVTVVGPGGVGKTRLALEALSRYDGRTRVVDLVPLSDALHLDQAVAHATGAVLTRNRAALDSVGVTLSGAPTLILLDNAEHLVDPVARWAEGLLYRCPDLTVLVTSRSRLAVPGETVFPLNGMTGDDGVALFRARALSAGAAEELDTSRVSAIVDAVDGLALAIELAAVRLPSLGLAGVEAGLFDQTDLLTGGSPSVARHRSMQATLDWSVALLDPSVFEALRRLAVFASPFTLEDSERVVGGDVRSAIAVLREQNLVATSSDGRLRLLEPVRQYARGRLTSDDSIVFEQHLVWVRDQVSALASLPNPAPALRRVDDDARAALLWAEGQELAGTLAIPYATALFRSGRLDESRRWFESGGDLAAAAAVARIAVQGPEALRLELARASGPDRARALANAAEMVLRFRGMFGAEVPDADVHRWLSESDGAAAAVARSWSDGSDAREIAEASGDLVLISSAYDKACADLLAGEEHDEADRVATRRIALLLSELDDPAVAFELKDALHMGIFCALAVQDVDRARTIAQRQADLPFLREQRDVAEEEVLPPAVLAEDWDTVDAAAERVLADWTRAGRPPGAGRALSAASVALSHGLRGNKAARAEWLAVTATLRGVPLAQASTGTGYGELFDAMVLVREGEPELAAEVLRRGLATTGLFRGVFSRWMKNLLSDLIDQE